MPAREPSRPAATYVRLKGAEEMAQERVLGAEGEHLPLDQRTVDVVVLQHDVLLQALDRVVVVGVFQLGQKHLPEKMGWVNKSRLAQARVKGSGSVAKKKKNTNIARPYLAEAALAQHGEEVEVVHVVLPEARYHGGGCGQLARLLELGVRVGRLCCGTSQTTRVGWWV